MRRCTTAVGACATTAFSKAAMTGAVPYSLCLHKPPPPPESGPSKLCTTVLCLATCWRE